MPCASKRKPMPACTLAYQGHFCSSIYSTYPIGYETENEDPDHTTLPWVSLLNKDPFLKLSHLCIYADSIRRHSWGT